MAYKFHNLDFSNLQQAQNQLAKTKEEAGNANQQQIQLNQLSLQKQASAWNTGLGIAKDVLDFSQSMVQLQTASQQSSLKVKLNDVQANSAKLIYNGIQDGSIYWGTDSEGKPDIVLSDDYKDWMNKQYELVDSKDYSLVKKWGKEQLSSIFTSEKISATQQVAQKSLNDIKSNFSALYDTTLASSVKSGDFSPLASLISSRADLSPAGKNQLTSQATQAFNLGLDENSVHAVATMYGADAAKQLVDTGKFTKYGDTDSRGIPEVKSTWTLKGTYLEDQKSMLRSKADRDYADLSDNVNTNVSDMVQNGLDSGKKSPRELLNSVKNQTASMPDTLQNKAKQTAQKLCTTWATEQYTSLLISDDGADIDTLKAHRDSIKDGPLYESVFNGVPSVQKNALAHYDSLIKSAESAGATSMKAEDAEKVKTNNWILEGISSQVQGNKISGNTALGMISAMKERTDGTVSLDDDVEVQKLEKSIMDGIVPEAKKPGINAFISKMNSLNWGVVPQDMKASSIKPDQYFSISKAYTDAHTRIINLFMNSADISDSQIETEEQAIMDTYIGAKLDNVSTPVKDPFGASTANDDAIRINSDMKDVQAVFLDERTKEPKWINDKVKKTYESVAGQMVTSILPDNGIIPSYSEGDQESQKESVMVTGSAVADTRKPQATLLDIDGEVYATPVVKGHLKSETQEYSWAMDNGDLFRSADNGRTWEFYKSISKTKESYPDSTVSRYFEQFRSSTESMAAEKKKLNDQRHKRL